MPLLVVPTPCFPKFMDVGVTDAAAVVTPVPDNATTMGPFGSSVVMVSVPVLVPAAVGAKVTLIVQMADVVIGTTVQVLKGKTKSPVTWILEIVTGLIPTLERITVRGALFVPTPWFPKPSDVAETEADGVVTPVPVSAIIAGLAGSSVVMISEPVLVPDAVGVNVTFIVQPTPVDIGAAMQVLDGKLKSPVA